MTTRFALAVIVLKKKGVRSELPPILRCPWNWGGAVHSAPFFLFFGRKTAVTLSNAHQRRSS